MVVDESGTTEVAVGAIVGVVLGATVVVVAGLGLRLCFGGSVVVVDVVVVEGGIVVGEAA